MAGEGDARSSTELAVKHVSWSKEVCAVAAGRWPSRLVATAAEDRLSFGRKSAHVVWQPAIAE